MPTRRETKSTTFNPSQSRVATYLYGPFGQIISSSGTIATNNPIRFSSEQFDADLGLVYYNYRYYSPELGRWLSKDPIGEKGGKNLYLMCGNSVVNVWDMLGQKELRAGSWRAILEEAETKTLDEALDAYEKRENDYNTNYCNDLFSLDTFSNFFAAWADTLTSGLTNEIRESLHINDMVNKDSISYKEGELIGMIHSSLIAVTTGVNYIAVKSKMVTGWGVKSKELRTAIKIGKASFSLAKKIVLGYYTDKGIEKGIEYFIKDEYDRNMVKYVHKNLRAATKMLLVLKGIHYRNVIKNNSKDGMILVTSWAKDQVTPDLQHGRWVMIGKATKLNYFAAGCPAGLFKHDNYITGYVEIERLKGVPYLYKTDKGWSADIPFLKHDLFNQWTLR